MNTSTEYKINVFNWKCRSTWVRSIKNTLWCLFGCSIGDFGTIFFFQIYNFNLSSGIIMILAIINGLITSIFLETLILFNQMSLKKSFYAAISMSFISMISMEVSMNLLDYIILGEAKLVWWVIPIMLLVGFLTPLPYNYWRLKKYNISCH